MMIKPDGVENGHIGAILEKITSSGFKVKALKLTQLPAPSFPIMNHKNMRPMVFIFIPWNIQSQAALFVEPSERLEMVCDCSQGLN
mgnify:CR=1 FL=1